MFTWENTWKEIEDSGVDVAVVPVGSTEQHGTQSLRRRSPKSSLRSWMRI
jgi:hypothetical protein